MTSDGQLDRVLVLAVTELRQNALLDHVRDCREELLVGEGLQLALALVHDLILQIVASDTVLEDFFFLFLRH